jgi:hypothetical protein
VVNSCHFSSNLVTTSAFARWVHVATWTTRSLVRLAASATRPHASVVVLPVPGGPHSAMGSRPPSSSLATKVRCASVSVGRWLKVSLCRTLLRGDDGPSGGATAVPRMVFGNRRETLALRFQSAESTFPLLKSAARSINTAVFRPCACR